MIPVEYRDAWRPEEAASIEAQLVGLLDWRDATLASLPANVDPRSIEEVVLETHLRSLVSAFMGASKANEVGRAEIIVCALTNVLGSIVMAGCRDPDDMVARIGKLGKRLSAFALDEMGKRDVAG